MDIFQILSKVDNTLLSQTATSADIKALCDDSIRFKTASVCVPPSYAKEAAEYLQSQIAVCTVIGFPNGNTTSAAKCFEAEEALKNGAAEIDMVINIGWLKDKRYRDISGEISSLREICRNSILKVIIETYFLTDGEKIEMCRIVTDTGADYIKTSTGFASGGATAHDIELFAEHTGPFVKIKAAGGISSFEDAEKFIQLGASRLGTSRLVKLAKESKLI